MGMSNPQFPEGWDKFRIKRVIDYYDAQSDDEAAMEDQEDKEAFESATDTAMVVPVELVPEVREPIAKRSAS